MTTEVKAISLDKFKRSTPGIARTDLLKAELRHIFVKPGVNPRDMTKPSTLEKIQRMKKSFMAGEFVPPIQCTFEDGQLTIAEGECRFTEAFMADKELREGGLPGIKSLDVNVIKVDEKERILLTIQANNGEALTPIEISKQAKALLNQGWSPEETATFLGYSRNWVDFLLKLAYLPEAVKRQISHGKVSAQTALSFFKKHGSGAAEAIELAHQKKSARVTNKDLGKPVNKQKAFYANAKTLFSNIPAIGDMMLPDDDDSMVSIMLPAKSVRALKSMQENIGMTSQPAN